MRTRNALPVLAVVLVGLALPGVAAAQAIGTPTAFPTTVPVAVGTPVRVTAQISSTSVIPASIVLQRIDAAGRVVGTLGTLVDDGPNGDVTANDRFFTARPTLYEPGAGTVRLRVAAAFQGRLALVLSAPVTVTVTCPTDNKTATDTVNIQVTAPPARQYTFEDVHFDFDRYSLRPEATRKLDEAVAAMQKDPTVRIEIEGHTCNIGTAEYNLALGDRRAGSVRDYLTSRGITADRMTTKSFGEERPKHDNAREETRRLNRRAALVVRVVK